MVGAPVPKAAVHEDRDPGLRKHDVGFTANARKRPDVNAETQSAVVERRAELSFRRSVP